MLVHWLEEDGLRKAVTVDGDKEDLEAGQGHWVGEGRERRRRAHGEMTGAAGFGEERRGERREVKLKLGK